MLYLLVVKHMRLLGQFQASLLLFFNKKISSVKKAPKRKIINLRLLRSFCERKLLSLKTYKFLPGFEQVKNSFRRNSVFTGCLKVSRASCWSLKHSPGRTICFDHSNPLKRYGARLYLRVTAGRLMKNLPLTGFEEPVKASCCNRSARESCGSS